jgi:hypothetical protein
MGAALGKCSQCDRPAMFVAGPDQMPLCLQCAALAQQMVNSQIQEAMRGADRALDDMEMITGIPMRPRRSPPAPVVVTGNAFHNISVNNSTVGVVNTGQLHQVDSSISAIAGSGDDELAKAFAAITSAVMASAQLSGGSRQEIVEILSVLTGEGTLPRGRRKTGVARPLISRLRELLGTAADVITVATPLLPVIAGAFGVS